MLCLRKDVRLVWKNFEGETWLADRSMHSLGEGSTVENVNEANLILLQWRIKTAWQGKTNGSSGRLLTT